MHQFRSLFRHLLSSIFLSSLGYLTCLPAQAQISVKDDAQRKVSIEKPATRIISLAPHVTELVFAAGAGQYLVGVSEYSDYPEQAKHIQSIGNIFALDLERLLALKPDLVIIWGTGNAKQLANKLRDNKESEPRNYEDIANSIEKIAQLSKTEKIGFENAKQFRVRLEHLRNTYQLKNNEKPITVFHQMVKSPLMTTNREHFISKMIELCGGKNVFADLKEISASISLEALLAANPEFIFSSGQDNSKLLQDWKSFPNLTAVKKQNLFSIPGDWLHRSGPRVLDATELLCKNISEAKKKI